ncbi:MAG: exo-alpha-sialidase [Pirellulales bacterium]|nr:exo-alpha-sialidase [Pirellulales bacterium]
MKMSSVGVIIRLFVLVAMGPVLVLVTCAPARGVAFFETTVFESGTDGYAYYRIPSIVKANDGTLLAFAEGRKDSRNDSGDIDLVLRRSFDNGVTWDPMQVVWSNGTGVAGNPCPVVDQITGDILLISNHQTPGSTQQTIRDGTLGERTYQVQRSTDSGAAWTAPVQITATDVLNPRWLAGGPNHGIQLTRGSEPGRLVIAGNLSLGSGYDTNRGHVLYSDDGGTTWELGAVSGYNADIYVSETAAVELLDGSLYFSTRDQNGPSTGNRASTTSHDAGESFDVPFQIDPTVVSPVCQGSILRYSSTDQGDSVNRILQSYPNSPTDRVNVMIRSSYDEASTWTSGRVIYEGSSAYSDLVRTADNRVGVLYERDSYATITFASFTTGWLDEIPDLKLHSTMRNADPAAGILFDDYGNNDGQLNGNAVQVVDPARGNVLASTAYGDTVTYGDVLDPMGASYSAAFWFKISKTGASQLLASKGMNFGSGDIGWATLYSTDGNLYFRANYDGTSNNRLAVRHAFSTEDFDQWHHLVVVIDQENGVLRAYLDGEGSGISGGENGWSIEGYNRNWFSPGTVFDSPDDLALARSKSVNAMNGLWDDFAVWTRALTDAEVLAIYNGTITIPTTLLPGDANNDGQVDALDAQRLAENWLAGDATWNMGDFNGDLVVDDLDASILAANWGNTAVENAVPEPSTLVGLLSLAGAVLRRRKGATGSASAGKCWVPCPDVRLGGGWACWQGCPQSCPSAAEATSRHGTRAR